MLLTTGSSEPIHEMAQPLAFLIGAWQGTGLVRFHTVGEVEFEEKIVFSHRGRPWIVYEQDSWRADDKSPLHTEVGIWRLVDDEMHTFVSLTAGMDYSKGTMENQEISLSTLAAPMAEGIEVVSELTRRYKVVGDVMTYQIHMETDAQPFIEHLTATLTRSRD